MRSPAMPETPPQVKVGLQHVPVQPFFGRQLRAMRLKRRMSQAELAGEGISTAYLSRLEGGSRPPTEKIVAYLAERLGVGPAEFADARPATLSEILADVASGVDAAQAAEQLRDALRDEASSADRGLRWQAGWVLATLQTRDLDRRQALEIWTGLAALSDDIGNATLRVRARNQLALCHRSLGDISATHSAATQAHEIAAAHRIPAADLARTLMILVSAEAELGRLHDAHTHMLQLQDTIADTPGTLRVEAMWTAATVNIRRGDNIAAQTLLSQALAELDSRQDLVLWLRLRLAAASLYLQMTPPQTGAAETLLQQAEPAVTLAGSNLHEQEFLLLQAQLAFQQNRPDAAWQACGKLEPKEDDLTFRDHIRFSLLRNQILLQRGEHKQAISNLRDLAQHAEQAANIDLAAEIWRTIANAPPTTEPAT